MNKKPLIVITPSEMPMEAPFHNNYTYSNCYNTQALLQAGGLPVIAPFLEPEEAEALLARADGLLLSGGADVSPRCYGQETLPECGELEPDRDRSDRVLLEAALKLKKPVLCICRGCQMANVYFGGTLYQDLPTQRNSEIAHDAETYPEYTRETAHKVRIVSGTPLARLLGRQEIGVNSLHHQAICKLAPGLVPMAYAPDGLVESWYLPEEAQWLRAYQWHPEMEEDNENKSRILGDFIEACRESK